MNNATDSIRLPPLILHLPLKLQSYNYHTPSDMQKHKTSVWKHSSTSSQLLSAVSAVQRNKKNSCSLFAANRNTGASNIYYGLCLLWLPQDLLDAACFLSEEKTVSAQICSQIWSAYILTPVFVGSGSQTRDPKWWAQMNISRVKIKGYSRLQVWQ